jgi:hypothetical protein
MQDVFQQQQQQQQQHLQNKLSTYMLPRRNAPSVDPSGYKLIYILVPVSISSIVEKQRRFWETMVVLLALKEAAALPADVVAGAKAFIIVPPLRRDVVETHERTPKRERDARRVMMFGRLGFFGRYIVVS